MQQRFFLCWMLGTDDMPGVNQQMTELELISNPDWQMVAACLMPYLGWIWYSLGIIVRGFIEK